MGGVVTGHWGGDGASSSSSSSSASTNKKKWSNLMPLVVILVVITEIAFLGRLDMAKNAAMVQTWTNTFHFDSLRGVSSFASQEDGFEGMDVEINTNSSSTKKRTSDSGESGGGENCEVWLEKQDAVSYSRDFQKDPVLVSGVEEEWNSCAVGCKFGSSNKKIDAAFGTPRDGPREGVLRSMESSHYYIENNVAQARGKGYSVIMTTSLSSDVPVGYFSWAEYDIMAPIQPKTESALAAAFISNCAARNFRLQALEALEKLVKIDSYGGCHRTRDGRAVDKVDTLKRYKFSLAFENSNEEDYVTEKFFQSLVADLLLSVTNYVGAVPVFVGAPNIMDFAPSPLSVLHIRNLSDVPSVAKTMKYLADNPVAYNQAVSWKYDGPSDSFKALVDMAAVHSSCRLCIHLATKIQETEERNRGIQQRPCKCSRGVETVYHLYVRERGRFEMTSIFLRSGNLTLNAWELAVLAKFESLNHVPIWKQERPESIRGGDKLKVYRIYPVGMTQREALYTFRFKSNDAFKSYIESNPCAKFEVIFV